VLAPFCGASLFDDGRCTWTLWAPLRSQVDLLLYDADGQPTAVPMTRSDDGRFLHTQADIVEGQRYAFQLDGGPPRPDPASRWQPDGVHAPSAIWRPDTFRWTDAAWRNIARDELVIYELHVGTFTPEGTFDAVIPRLAELRDLGITAIEIMPVGAFPGTRDWGYDGTFWYAVQESYGGPRGLQQLIDACHAQGLAVILDVIYNHLGPEGNYLREFGPYFTDRYHTPWGQALNYDGPDAAPVRRFVLDSVRQWIRDFHVDGLRLDAVQTIFDNSTPHILAEIQQAAAEEAEARGQTIHVIAETDENDIRHLDPPERGGHGLAGVWSDDFHHSVHALVTGERGGYYTDFDDPARQLVKAFNETFVYDGAFSRYRGRPHGTSVKELPGDRFVVSVQNHDQVGNRARGERLSELATPAQLRLAAGLLLLSPYVPLLFMGEEYSERRPFPFFCDFGDADLQDAVRRGRREEFARFGWTGDVPDALSPETFASAKLTWSWPDGSVQAGLRQLYRDLLSLRRSHPALRDCCRRQAELDGDVLVLTRGDVARTGHRLWAAFNLGTKSATVLPPGWSEAGWRRHSEAADYHGTRSDEEPTLLLPHEFGIWAGNAGKGGR
jgi:maltooligosyltrehalose trehalohydrolase